MRLFLTALAVLALFAAFGCGNNEAESADAKEQAATENTETANEASADDMTATGDPYFDSLAQMTHPIRSEENPIVTISTDYGDMTLELYRDVAPAHADSFVARTKDGFYNGLTFHRIVDGFMIQGGDPKGNGTGNAGYYLPAEFSDLPHKEGTLSMARSRNPNSASCQFFICLDRAAFLDKQYTVFGQLLDGYDTLHKIGKLEVVASPGGEQSKPVETVYMRKVFVSDAEGNPAE